MIVRRTDYIRTPWSQRLRRFRQSVLPLASFCGCVLLALWLWERQTLLPNAVGEVEAVRIDVAAGTGGILTTLPRGQWTLFDRIEAQAVVARLDDRPVRAEMATLQADLARLRSELIATAEQLALDESGRESDYQRESRRLAWQVQQHRLDALDRRTLIETDRVEQMRLETEISFLEPLRRKGSVTEMQLVDGQLRRDLVRKRIAENERGLLEAKAQLESVTTALRAYPERRAATVDKLLLPIEAAITVGQRRLDEVQVRIETLEIRSPISGTICAILGWPGQNIRAGDPVVTVAAEQGRQIVCYVRQEQRLRPQVGMAVTLRPAGTTAHPVASVVARVGPQVELVPLHHLHDSKRPEWGQPVSIQLPANLILRPGELIPVVLHQRRVTES